MRPFDATHRLRELLPGGDRLAVDRRRRGRRLEARLRPPACPARDAADARLVRRQLARRRSRTATRRRRTRRRSSSAGPANDDRARRQTGCVENARSRLAGDAGIVVVVLAEHLHVAAQRDGRERVLGLAAPPARTAPGRSRSRSAAPSRRRASRREVPELVHEDEHAERDDEGDSRSRAIAEASIEAPSATDGKAA